MGTSRRRSPADEPISQALALEVLAAAEREGLGDEEEYDKDDEYYDADNYQYVQPPQMVPSPLPQTTAAYPVLPSQVPAHSGLWADPHH